MTDVEPLTLFTVEHFESPLDPITEVRSCSDCGRARPLAEFHKAHTRNTGTIVRSNVCRSCRNTSAAILYAAHRDGIYERLWHEQRGVCALASCDRWYPLSGRGPAKRLHVDHDHRNGQIRGLLCPHHNKGLGYFRDRPVDLIAAVAYLTRPTDPDVEHAYAVQDDHLFAIVRHRGGTP